MDVKTLCLGLLSIREARGYDLKKAFESTFKHFYPAGYGSIYPALAGLAENGLVICREIPQEGKPDRKIYRITDEGRRHFRTVLRETQPQHKLRSEFLAMLYFADLMEPERLSDLLDQRLDALRAAVVETDDIEKDWDANSAGAKFIAGFGAHIAKAAAEYIEANREALLEQTRKSSANSAGQPADQSVNTEVTIENRP
jgi:PadR family transcriptional regulator AphA